MIAPDGKWEYAPDVIDGLRVRLSDHSGNTVTFDRAGYYRAPSFLAVLQVGF
jgi:hypothetical protein